MDICDDRQNQLLLCYVLQVQCLKIASLWQQAKSISSLCEELLDYCLSPSTRQQEGCDNMSVIIVQLKKFQIETPTTNESSWSSKVSTQIHQLDKLLLCSRAQAASVFTSKSSVVVTPILSPKRKRPTHDQSILPNSDPESASPSPTFWLL